MEHLLIRPYRLDVFGLQDNFIKTLKPTHLNELGSIDEPKFIVKDDGTSELEFSIPMYYRVNGELISNPLWASIEDGTIMENLRKIKLIFNEEELSNLNYNLTTDDGIYEFIINTVTESHKDGILKCDVKADGLAFNELGKTGYLLTFNQDEFLAEYENNPDLTPTLNYWMDKLIDGTSWHYEVKMDYDSYYDRDIDKVYEDSYTSSWQIVNNQLIPKTYEVTKIKERIPSIEKSNRYNITQELANIFEINCKYQYLYDSNYHIIDRKIIFFNNFIKEKDDSFDINYPFNATAITREKDSNDLITKMFVEDIQDDSLPSGYISIIDSDANKTGENYILNFDYLYKTGGIQEDKYQEIKKFEKNIYTLNKNIKELTPQLDIYQKELIEQQALYTYNYNSKIAAEEQKNILTQKIEGIFGEDRLGSYIAQNPYHAYVINNGSNNIVNLRKVGIDITSIKFSTIQTPYNFISLPQSATVVRNESGSIIYGLDAYANQELVFIFDFNVASYYSDIEQLYQNLANEAEEKASAAQVLINDYQEKIDNLNIQLSLLYDEKKEIKDDFEKMMGPALREGTWDNKDYIDYGEKIEKEETDFYYDAISFDGEQLLYEEIGVAQEKKYFPYINLSSGTGAQILSDINSNNIFNNFCLCGGNYWEETVFTNEVAEWSNQTDYSIDDVVIYANKYYKCVYAHNHLTDGPKVPTQFSIYNSWTINGQLQFQYVKKSNTIIPVLLFIKDYDTALLQKLKINPCLRKLIIDTNTKSVEIPIVRSFSNLYNNVIIEPTNEWAQPIYLRFEIENDNLKTQENELDIKYTLNLQDVLLQKYEDYSLLYRESNIINGVLMPAKYYITPKIYHCLKYKLNKTNNDKWFLQYMLSNAATKLFLDALLVSNENSIPKVSYEVEVAYVNKDSVKYLYKKLNQICFINDTELKFDHARGYISELELFLNSPQDDKITIKNYKTKFEDLFSTIVASTETMKSNEVMYNRAAGAFDSNGTITESALQKSLSSKNFEISMNNGNLTIDENNGIWAISDNGVVAMRGGGIYTATQQDGDGNWLWNTGISPSGINAKLITAGQLDTELIQIYGGDNVAFQLNSNGLYAYHKNNDVINDSEYVVHNGEGLFLVNKDIEKVVISWDGLVIKNNNNEIVFNADDDGNLVLAASITANDGEIGGWTIENNQLSSQYKMGQTIIGEAGINSIGNGSFTFENETLNDNAFWIVGEENYFRIDKYGNAYAKTILSNKIVADQAIIGNIDLSNIITAAKGIRVTDLLGVTFYTLSDTLQFTIVPNEIAVNKVLLYGEPSGGTTGYTIEYYRNNSWNYILSTDTDKCSIADISHLTFNFYHPIILDGNNLVRIRFKAWEYVNNNYVQYEQQIVIYTNINNTQGIESAAASADNALSNAEEAQKNIENIQPIINNVKTWYEFGEDGLRTRRLNADGTPATAYSTLVSDAGFEIQELNEPIWRSYKGATDCERFNIRKPDSTGSYITIRKAFDNGIIFALGDG